MQRRGAPGTGIYQERRGICCHPLERLADGCGDKDLGINARQKIALKIVKETSRVNSTDYSTLAEISRQTAFRDLNDLVRKGVLEKQGITGKGTYYTLRKRLRKVT